MSSDEIRTQIDNLVIPEGGAHSFGAKWRPSGPETPPKPLNDAYPHPDIPILEAAAESLVRLGDVRSAIALWAIVLRLRMEATK